MGTRKSGLQAMIDNGYIFLYRKFIDWGWYTDIPVKCLFLHLLLLANHKETKWRGEVIGRGQVLTGLHQLSQGTGLSVQQIRTALGKLISTNEITSKTTNKYRVITIINYASYQDKKTSKQQAKQQAEQQTTNNQSTTSNTLKKEEDKSSSIYGDTSKKIPPEKNDTYLYFVELGLSKEESKEQTIKFHDHHDARGWRYGQGKKMVDWKAAVRTWKTNIRQYAPFNGSGNGKSNNSLLPEFSSMVDSDFWSFYHPYKQELNCTSLNGLIPTREEAQNNLTAYLKQKIAKYGKY